MSEEEIAPKDPTPLIETIHNRVRETLDNNASLQCYG
jgi:hypothetical protein